MTDQCTRRHERLTLVPGLSVCECGLSGPLASRQGIEAEVERLVQRAGGLQALRAREFARSEARAERRAAGRRD